MKPTPKMEASIKKAFTTAYAGNGILSESAFNEAFTWGVETAKIIKVEARRELLKSLVKEVEGMKLPTSTRNYITKAEPINKKLQDVIKLLEKYE